MGKFCSGGEVLGALADFVVVGQDHAATAGGHNFVAVERDHSGEPEGSGVLALAGLVGHERAQAFGRVFNHRDAVFSGNLTNLFDANRVTKRVHWADGRDAGSGGWVHNFAVGSGHSGERFAKCIRAHAHGAKF